MLTVDEAKYQASATSATVVFNEVLLQKLMDDVYDAEPKEVAVKNKWQGADLARLPTDAEKAAGTSFIYRVVQPKGTFFDNVFDGEKEVWRKLWRDMLWNIPRSRPTTREPYNHRPQGQMCKEGPNTWAALEKVYQARAKNAFFTSELSSALFPGAQAVNAEGVAFQGRAEQNLLLHFWPLTVLLFVPQEVQRDGATELPPSSFSVAIPDVMDLSEFIDEYPKLLQNLAPTRRGYRPAQAVVDLPAEGALAFLENLAVLTGLEVETSVLRFSIGAVEYLHLIKKGNNVKVMASGRVSPVPHLLAGYRAITCPRDESIRFRNPLFRRGLLVALLDGSAWYQPYQQMFSTFDAAVFVRQPRKSGGESGTPQFASDALKKFRHETKVFLEKLKRYEHMSMNEKPPAPLPVLVERVIRNYLLGKAKAKCNLDPKVKLKALTEPQRQLVYAAKAKLAEETFLAARSRRDADFVSYFSSVICSAGTYFERDSSDFQTFAVALIDPAQTDNIKTLTLLALSANS